MMKAMSAHPPETNRALPNLSAMLKVGQLRHIQCTHESGEHWNPDVLVSKLLSPRQRWTCFWRSRLLLERLRADPFYDYLVARTKYYDDVFVGAIYGGTRTLINVGSGSDTRAYRYAHHALQRGADVFEFDQAEAIAAKRAVARRHFPAEHVTYLPIDLNQPPWESLDACLEPRARERALVMLEGVSPYVDADTYTAFLRMLSRRLAPGSLVAYDYKLRGKDAFLGRTATVERPFRLGNTFSEVVAFHVGCGFTVEHLESSAELVGRLVPSPRTSGSRFDDDGLIRLGVSPGP